MRRLGMIAAAAVLLCGACRTTDTPRFEPRHFQPDGPYVHQATGMSFPPTIGGFQRTGIGQYDAEATNVSAGYNVYHDGDVVAITVYVYPAPPIYSFGSPRGAIEAAHDRLCGGEFGRVKAAIEHGQPGAAPLDEDTIPSPFASHEGRGRRAVYAYVQDVGGVRQPVRSEAILYCYVADEWLIKFRTTAAEGTNYRPALLALMLSLPWPATK